MIGGSSKYKYLNQEAPNSKIDYSYSSYNGENFLVDWKTSREKIVDIAEIFIVDNNAFTVCQTSNLFLKWIKSFDEGLFSDYKNLNLLLKRFEVTRKIFETYDENFRPKEKLSSYQHIDLYILFSYILTKAYQDTKKLYYLNSLLKVNDIVISNVNQIKEGVKSTFQYCINQELVLIDNLRNEL